MSRDVAIAVMARAPQPGFAKTRLIPKLGPQGAADLHAKLVHHALQEITASKLQSATLWCAPDTSHGFFSLCAENFDIELEAQVAGDLGARMAAVFAQAQGPLLLMGSDCPAVDAQLLIRCADHLRAGAPAVFLPAEDGGYGLVGLARDLPAQAVRAIFTAMPWGTDQVMTITRARLAEHGVATCEPAIIWDVDRPEDLDRLEKYPFNAHLLKG